MGNNESTVKKGGNPQNLKPFPKGVSGNPKGAPKKLPDLDRILANVIGNDEESEAIIRALYKKALKGDTRAAEILLDRGWGKVKQSIAVESTIIEVIPPEPE